MKKKNGVNIMLFAFITIFIGILSCSKSPKNQTAGFLLQKDRDFSAILKKYLKAGTWDINTGYTPIPTSLRRRSQKGPM
jgi:hypothetical protein